ncbi:MAG TPA: glycosyltransferase domain-containing protein [Opitutaceae bacterium]|nr:glycosyltransferase domain-containing protein [Opitutaceae bacterium]
MSLSTSRPSLVVYTAITQGYDSLKALPRRWQEEADCIAYVEGPASSGWRARPVCREFADECRNAKVHKIVPHDLFEEYEYSIWIDGSVIPRPEFSPRDVIEKVLRAHDLAVFKHRIRGCIYEEAQACIQAGKDNRETIERQMARYRQEGYPARNGLNECTILVRRHSPDVRRVCEAWHREIEAGSRRDQLSFNYVVHRARFEVGTLPGTILNNPYFTWHYHDPHGGPVVPVQ